MVSGIIIYYLIKIITIFKNKLQKKSDYFDFKVLRKRISKC